MKIKEGKWFASAKLRNKFLLPEEKANWLNNLNICIQIAQAVNQIHNKNLVHLDLSCSNIWIDVDTWKVYLNCTEDNIVCG